MAQRKLPDLNICKTKPFGPTKSYLCLVDHPFTCKYSFHFDKQNFCNHPEKEKLCMEEKPDSETI